MTRNRGINALQGLQPGCARARGCDRGLDFFLPLRRLTKSSAPMDICCHFEHTGEWERGLGDGWSQFTLEDPRPPE